MSNHRALTHRELDLMSVLWRRGSATVAEIRDELTDDLAYPTVQTMLRVLETKGLVRHTLEGRAFRFFPLIKQDDEAEGVLHTLVQKVYHGSRELLVNRLLADENIPADELRRIEKMLKRRIKEAEE